MTNKQQKIVLVVASVSLIAALALVLYYYFVTNVSKEELNMYEMKHFSFDELTRSSKATALGIDNSVQNEEVRDNLLALVMKVLDPARDLLGAPITINSAYRSKELNYAVGGQASSQHLTGQAADLTTGTKAGNERLYNIIKQLGNFDQLINEKDYSWVHVSYKRIGYNRKSAFKQD